MPFIDKPLGPWRPDLGDLQHDGMAEAEGVYAVAGGYALHPKAAAEGSATIDAIARGAYCTRESDGGTSLFVGNATKLYQRTSTAFTDVSDTGGYSTGTDDHWEFAQYDSTVIATNYADDPAYFQIGTSSGFQQLASQTALEATVFDDATEYFTRAALTGAVDGKEGTLSLFMRRDLDGTRVLFEIADSGGAATTRGLSVRTNGTNKITVAARNTSGTTILSMETVQAYGIASEFIHVLASWDLAAGAAHLYINDVEDQSVATNTDDTIDYTKTLVAVATSATNAGAVGPAGAALGEVWFDDSYIDLSVEANRRLFVQANGAPEDLGSDGSTPTGSSPLVYLSGGDDSFANNLGTGGDFTEAGSPTATTLRPSSEEAPKARHIGVIGDFVFLGYTNDATNGAVPYRVQWSGIGEPTAFPAPGTTDAQNSQADEEYLDPEYGDIRGIAGGKDFGLVFQENAITRFSYVGGTAIFEVDTYERGRGLIAPRAFAQVGGQTYFVSNDGVYVTDGVNVQSIGDGVIDKTLIEDVDRDNLNYFSTAVDYTNKLIYFSIPNGTGSDKAYIYNYAENRWSLVNYVDLIGDATASVGCVVRGFSLDSQQVPQVFVLGGYNEGAGVLHKLREFDGDLSPFTLRTGVMEFPQITYLDGASVYGDNASTYTPTTAAPFKVYASESSAIGISGGESGAHTVTTTGSANARTGKVDFRISARTASFELSSTAALSGVTSQKIQKFRVYHKGGSQA